MCVHHDHDGNHLSCIHLHASGTEALAVEGATDVMETETWKENAHEDLGVAPCTENTTNSVLCSMRIDTWGNREQVDHCLSELDCDDLDVGHDRRWRRLEMDSLGRGTGHQPVRHLQTLYADREVEERVRSTNPLKAKTGAKKNPRT